MSARSARLARSPDAKRSSHRGAHAHRQSGGAEARTSSRKHVVVGGLCVAFHQARCVHRGVEEGPARPLGGLRARTGSVRVKQPPLVHHHAQASLRLRGLRKREQWPQASRSSIAVAPRACEHTCETLPREHRARVKECPQRNHAAPHQRHTGEGSGGCARGQAESTASRLRMESPAWKDWPSRARRCSGNLESTRASRPPRGSSRAASP